MAGAVHITPFSYDSAATGHSVVTNDVTHDGARWVRYVFRSQINSAMGDNFTGTRKVVGREIHAGKEAILWTRAKSC